MSVQVKTTAKTLIDTAGDIPVVTWQDSTGAWNRLYVRPGSNPPADFYYLAKLTKCGASSSQWLPAEMIGLRSDDGVMTRVAYIATEAATALGKDTYFSARWIADICSKREDTVHTCQGMENTVEVASRDDLYELTRRLAKTDAVFAVTVVMPNGSDVTLLCHPFDKDMSKHLYKLLATYSVEPGRDRVFLSLKEGSAPAVRVVDRYAAVLHHRPGTVIL